MRSLSAVLIAATMGAATLLSTGCAEHHYRTYDPYYNDYHRWNADEDGYYRRWIAERHYQYVEYNRLEKERQKEYWDWRHKQEHHDHDRDHDHDHDRR